VLAFWSFRLIKRRRSICIGRGSEEIEYAEKLDLETAIVSRISSANGLFLKEEYRRYAYFGKEIFENSTFTGRK
jgi:hypothetical protein